MHANNDNAEFMSPHNVNDVVDEVFKSLFSRYQNNLEISMRGSDLICDSVQLFDHKHHKVNFRHGVSYVDSPN